MGFKIQNLLDDSVIEVLSMNIDSDHNILIQENQILDIISLDDFKDMIMGTDNENNKSSKKATYKFLH